MYSSIIKNHPKYNCQTNIFNSYRMSFSQYSRFLAVPVSISGISSSIAPGIALIIAAIIIDPLSHLGSDSAAESRSPVQQRIQISLLTWNSHGPTATG